MRTGGKSCAVLTDEATLAHFISRTLLLQSLDGDANHSLSYNEFRNTTLSIFDFLLDYIKDIL